METKKPETSPNIMLDCEFETDLVEIIEKVVSAARLPVNMVRIGSPIGVAGDQAVEQWCGRIRDATRFPGDQGPSRTLSNCTEEMQRSGTREESRRAAGFRQFLVQLTAIIEEALCSGRSVVEIRWITTTESFKSYAVVDGAGRAVYDSFMYFVPTQVKSGSHSTGVDNGHRR